jgi:hypothetical protein
MNDLRKALQYFNEQLGEYINEDQRYKLGRVLTIIDASIADPEQRKAMKNLVNNEWWSPGNKMRGGPDTMADPHADLRAICRVFDFELYPTDENPVSLPPEDASYTNWIERRYKSVISQVK